MVCNKKRKGLEHSIYPTVQTLQTDTTLELQIKPFCFLLRVMRSALIIKTMEYVLKLLLETKLKHETAAKTYIDSGGNKESEVYKENRNYCTQLEKAINILKQCKE